MRHIFGNLAYWAALLIMSCPLSVLAQTGGTLRGTVQDSQKAVVPRVRVNLYASGSLTPRTTLTDSSGTYKFEGVNAGSLVLEVDAPGFRRATRSLHVEAGAATVEDVVLEVAGISDSVVVTATRSETDVASAPISASVITLKDIDSRPLQTVDQQLTLTEGVRVQRQKGPAAIDANVALRGFTGASRTLVLLDGQPINDSYSGSVDWTGLPMDEVASIEVVRGPFSSLYGSNALGGVINIRTRPVDRRQLDLKGEYGTYDTTRLSAAFSDRLFNKLGVSLGFQEFRTGGYNGRLIAVTPGTGTGTLVTGPIPTFTTAGARRAIVGEGGRNWLNQRSIRAKAEYTIGPTSLVSLQYVRMGYRVGYDQYQSYLRDVNGNLIDSGAVVFDDNGVQRRLVVAPTNFLQSPAEQHSNFYSATYQRAFSSGSLLRVDGGYYSMPFRPVLAPGTGSTAVSGPGSLIGVIRRNAHVNIQYDRRVRRHALTFGAETRQDMASSSTLRLSNWTREDSTLNQTFFAMGRSITQSAYVQDQFAVTDRLSLVVGARHDFWKGYDGVSDGFNLPATRVAYPDNSNNKLNGKIALGYSLPRDWNLRLSAGTAFRNHTVLALASARGRSTSTRSAAATPQPSPRRAGLRSSGTGIVTSTRST